MDTPDKKTQPSPSFLSKFEDSPVFSYISTLSPIKPFSLGHSGQSFHLLSYASPQSLQTPPLTNCPKESKFKSASRISDVSENDCSQNGSEGASDAVQPADLHIEGVDKLDSAEEVTVSAAEDSLKPVSEHLKSLKYECGSENNVVYCGAIKPECELDEAGTEIFARNMIQDASKEPDNSFEIEMGVHENQVEHNKDVCEWEKFIYEASDILNCHSPTKESHHEKLDVNNVDSRTLTSVETVLHPQAESFGETQMVESVCPLVSTENHGSTEKPDGKCPAPAVKAHATLAEEYVHYLRTEIDEKSSSQQQQTASRRCLVYEMSGSHYRKLLSDPDGGSPISKPAVSPDTSMKKCLVASRPGSKRFSSLLPGIGLHLNALAATARDKIIVKRHTLTCRRQLISSPRSIPSSESLNSDTKPPDSPVAPEFVEQDCDEQKDGAQITGNTCENSTFGEGVEFLQISPKKKRKKSENGETDSCKRCNCKRSKCLKLYCECFAAGLYCVEPCNCQDCFNKPAYEETVLETRRQIESRNPLAFAPKVIKCSSTPNNGDESNKTPASARHKRGCNCKKSGCLKKYCECFQGGVGCSLSCRCEGCKNTFGRKEGTECILFEEAKILKKCASDVSSHDEISKTDDEDQATPEPSKHARQPVRQPFHFGNIAQQFPSLPSGPFLQSCTTQKTDSLDQIAFEEDIKIAPEDEASEGLPGDYLLPTTCVKSASPNCKRISPPHCDFETSPGWKSSRKLILRSISSFPTVSTENESTELQEELQ